MEFSVVCLLSNNNRLFFRCWTRKEAYIKAVGKGLLLPLDQFDVTLAPGEPATLLRADSDWKHRSYSLIDLPFIPGYAAALAIQEKSTCLQCWRWS
jgi:4'-phosphopantetheinyl transferase